jgi:8-oxo-dGTP pyrophosphatase MutT (NUDIX family)
MKYEKSCGAIIYQEVGGSIHFLIIKNRDGKHWGFPKGHVEAGETEEETALREVFEEVGLKIKIVSDFRGGFKYKVNERTEKEIVYFLAESKSSIVKVQVEEIEEFKWCKLDEAIKVLTYNDDRRLLIESQKYL